MKRLLFPCAALLWVWLLPLASAGQTGQLPIPRVSLMPNMPSPYLLRDWKDVAIRYDSFIFSLTATGQYLPVMHLKSSGVNYPALQPILLDSYVGASGNGTQAEAINIIPALVGSTLVGIDKSNQNGVNWALKAKEFFNKANGQNIYLNDPSGSSGSDWWYDLMPNVFFYQLYSQYPATADFATHFTTVADRWLSAVNAMGGSTLPWKLPQMNYVAFNFATMTPNSNGVAEPESAGTISWILYSAWLKTGNKKYLEGAQLAMGFLSSQAANPAYEIQLPYGTFVAARMNAEIGANYDISKMINWSFDQSSLRNWGTVVGTWGGSDVSGLVGEIDNPNTGYAFTMNGFEQAAALVPLVKYDKRFAHAVAKWVLNLANASRLFYPQFLAPASQDDFAWSTAHDPHSVIAYEALKQMSLSGNMPLYGTGDAKRNGWAQTNLGLYGSSHVGYLAAVVQKTNVDGILLLDMNKTDFFGQNAFPSFLLYNPGSTTSVTLPLGAQVVDIYDAISETVLYTGATGNYPVTAPANEVLALVYLPAGSVPVMSGGKLVVGDKVVDYHYGYHFTGKLRIKSLGATDTLVQFSQPVKIYSAIENAPAPATFSWYVNSALTSVSADSLFTWTVPAVAGTYTVRLTVTAGTESASDSLLFHVVAHIPVAPVISAITPDSSWYHTGATASLLCHATNADGGVLKYVWSVTGGSVVFQNDSLLHWQAPMTDGLYKITCSVTNSDQLTISGEQTILVKARSIGITPPLAWYPFDGDVHDYSGNQRDAILQGALPVVDARGESNHAYAFATSNDVIYVNNDAGLNFTNQITLSFWVNLNAVTQESYLLSHGSYEQRWKVSVLQNNTLRWTIKTASATTDLDSSFPLLMNHFYHFTVVYTGYDMEMYADGFLDTYLPASGPLSTTLKAITFGRKDLAITNYHLVGTLDEVRMYDKALAPDEIATLKTIWNGVTGNLSPPGEEVTVYPNPSRGTVTLSGIDPPAGQVTLTDMTGRKIESTYSYIEAEKGLRIVWAAGNSGILLLSIETASGVVIRKVMSF